MIVAMMVVNSVTCMCAMVAAGALVSIRDEARARDNDGWRNLLQAMRAGYGERR